MAKRKTALTTEQAKQFVSKLREDVMSVALSFQNREDAIAEALKDDNTRHECAELVNDLFSLVEVILDEVDSR